ncbi:hypothetical protein [Salibacterium aidingense]|uniref:hypothetical protein n=1 Tax=Salibacterium aidingense TaxID=384933 RepID=UPI000416706B|nr:hypothetical protein [Salibacterium aidingense]
MRSSEGAIIAEKIAAGSITTNMIDSAGINAGVITAGTMLLNRLEGGTLTLGGGSHGDGSLLVMENDETNIAEINKDTVAFSEITVGTINSPDIVYRNEEDYTIYVRQTGDDDNDGSLDFPKQTIQAAVSSIPKFNNGRVTVVIFDEGVDSTVY